MNVISIRPERTLLLLACTALLLTGQARAWDDCPFGQVNDKYPGKCGLYEDSNHDSICDHSQKPLLQLAANPDSALLMKAALTAAVPTHHQNAAKAAAPRRSEDHATAAIAPTAPAQAVTTAAPGQPSPLRQRYPLWQIFLITAVLAAITELLTARSKKLTLPLQAFWNWALLLSFLLTVAFSVPFVYPALLTAINLNLAYWHSLTGLVMIAAGLYHLIRRFGSMWRGARSWFG